MAAPAAPLRLARCAVHPAREAAARCVGCAAYFCRECVTEHGGRLLCAPCLRAAARPKAAARRGGSAGRLLGAAAGAALAWLFFWTLGRSLLLIPSSFHDGTIWTTAPGAAAR